MKITKKKVPFLLFFLFTVGLLVLYLVQPEWNKAKAGGVGFSLLLMAIAIYNFFRSDKEDQDNSI